MAFPVSPLNGQTTTLNGITYVYNSTSGTWTRVVVVNSTTSATAPSNPKVGDIWYDTATDDIYRYTTDGTSTYWIDITGPTVANSVTYLNTNVYANSFNGSSQYLNVANNAAFNFGSGAFTVEFWVNFGISPTSQQDIVTNYGGVSTGWAVAASSSLFYAGLAGDSGSAFIQGTTTILPGRWYHVALSGATGSIKLFLNGIQEGPTYSGAVALDTSAVLQIGRIATTAYFNGSISNLRIIKGTALYTAAFTVPAAPLTAITNTVLLTCQTVPIVDASTSSFAVTNVGGVGLSIYSAQQNPSLTLPINPTQTILTTATSGTYTVPANVKWLRVRMVGGGGGGGGAGSNGGGGGTAGVGGTSTFGTSLLTAYGGGGGTNYFDVGAAGGTATIAVSAGVSGVAFTGAAGAGGGVALGQYPPGGTGGVSPFGGGGAGGAVDTTTAYENAVPNTGSGGGGGGGQTSSGTRGGGGGGAGGYIDAIISSVTSSYSYSVGSGGTAGPAGSSGQVGGSGASGIIIIEEHYNY